MTTPDPITPEREPGGIPRCSHGAPVWACTEHATATPERVTLTEGERYALWQAGDHHPEVCDCAGDDWSADGDWCSGMEDTFEAVERVLSDRLREAKADAKAWEQNYDGMFARWAECDTERLALKERLREAEMHLRIARQDAEFGETP